MSRDRISDFRIDLVRARPHARVIIIDDETPPVLIQLRNLGFNLSHKTDISTLDEVRGFSVVACDINGVGKHFGGDGTFVISQIRSMLPDIYVIAFSSGNFDMRYQEAFRRADAVIPKGASTETWADTIDRGISSSLSPAEIWKRAHIELLKLGASAAECKKIEDRLLRHLNSSRPPTPEDLRQITRASAFDIDPELLPSHFRGILALGAQVASILALGKP